MALPAGDSPEILDDARIAQLGERGWLRVDGFLDAEAARSAHAEAAALRAEGRLTQAGVGHRGRHGLRRGVRGDLTCWLDEPELAPRFPALFGRFDLLRLELNRRAFLGLVGASVQLACYPGTGERYLRHRDAFADRAAARRLTAIVYLNPAWQPAHGGCLRLHGPPGEPAEDVAPLLGRLLLLLADEVEHEVLPAWAERWAATAFFHGPREIPGT
jgi:SM-20-related protein